MEPAIECKNLHRTFITRSVIGKRKKTVALDRLDFTIPKGIVFGLLGPNGSGKTTTVRILSTLLMPTTGTAAVCGFDVVSQSARVRRKIGLILGGDKGLYGRLSGVDNLRYFAALNHLSRRESEKRVWEVLKLVGLTDAARRLVEQYSRGMKQRLHIARGLVTDPDVLFMDEPTIGLDPTGALELRRLIPQLIVEGKTILLTTHYMSEADELCSRIAIVNKGRITASGTPTDIKRKFSNIKILEVIFRNGGDNGADRIANLEGITNVTANHDGPLTRLVVQTRPDAEIEHHVKTLIGSSAIQSIVHRDPTLEEAYLSIIK